MEHELDFYTCWSQAWMNFTDFETWEFDCAFVSQFNFCTTQCSIHRFNRDLFRNCVSSTIGVEFEDDICVTDPLPVDNSFLVLAFLIIGGILID
mgnify:CR=1 FL=1